jgi:effector-binding domain-containing protein
MAPLEQAPANPPEFGAEFKLGQTPDGRAIKFEHRGSYEEIDATYEAITAWLDEKGLDARDFFVEEFASLGTGPDDSASAVDVYVFVK